MPFHADRSSPDLAKAALSAFMTSTWTDGLVDSTSVALLSRLGWHLATTRESGRDLLRPPHQETVRLFHGWASVVAGEPTFTWLR